MSKLNKQFWVGASVILSAIVLWWVTDRVTYKQLLPEETEKLGPDYFIEDFTTHAMDKNGKRIYTLSAKKLVSYPSSPTLDLEYPYLIQYQKNETTHTKANRGKLARNRSKIFMRGDVHISYDRKIKAADKIQVSELTIHLDKKP